MPFSLRFSWIFNINLSLPLVLLLILGTAICFISKRKDYLLVGSAFLVALFLYLFPESYAYRFYKELTVVMAFVMAVGIWRLYVAISNLRKKHSAIILSVLIVVLLLPSLITPVFTRYQTSLGQSLIIEHEYSAAQWLKQNTPENSIIVSDFETIELLGTLSNRLLPIDRSYIIAGLNEESIQTLWHIKNMFGVNYVNSTLENENASQFWDAYSFGKGSIDIDPTNITQPDNNKAVKIIEGNKSVAGLIHKFTTIQNWSDASALYIKWFGQNTNSIWQVCVAASDDSNWFAFNFVDNFTGWTNISVSFKSFSKVGSPNWDMVSYIAIRTSNALPYSWSLGDVGLSYLTSLNINPEEINYLKNHITSTEQRYCQQTGLSTDNVTILIILTSRTIQWVKQDGISQAITPLKDPVDNSYLDLIKKTTCLEEIYSLNNEIYIYQVK